MDFAALNRIARRAHYTANKMIYLANNRDNVEKGDPKVGGHSSASSSALHILGTLHLIMKSGYDWIANKPHAAPADHSYNYLLDLFLNRDLSRLSQTEADQAMRGLRAFSQSGEWVFQSYHSGYDPDHHNFFPSGTVGIPPVNAGYLALAYKYAEKHGYDVPPAHFWAVMGDSEFREGSLSEAIPDFAERQLGNLTWIIDFNRQSLDGHRITNQDVMHGTDDLRIQRMLEANGWHVVHARHGKNREVLFERDGSQIFREFFEGALSDYELQVLLLLPNGAAIRELLVEKNAKVEKFLNTLKDEELYTATHDFGGHDFQTLSEAFQSSKNETMRPSMVIAHTIKGWGLKMAAHSGNHSAIPDEDELKVLAHKAGMPEGTDFARFETGSAEGKLLKARGDKLYADIRAQHELKDKNRAKFRKMMNEMGDMSDSLDINFKMANYPHTQWMLGQLTSKLTRIANTPLDEKKLKEKQKPLSIGEKAFRVASEMMVSMAPDVGTSTNLNPTMDGHIYSANHVDDIEAEMGVKDTTVPDLVPGEDPADRFLRFDIVESNVMSCVGSFGKLRSTLGIPLIPLMTVYDFFIKRALDQLFYNLYWQSSFVLVGTPAGVTLSPEGAQHGWKSDIQIPNQVTWEPYYVQELDWIFVDAVKRILLEDDHERCGVIIRGVTRGADQKVMVKRLKSQTRFEGKSEDEILKQIRGDVLAGGYYIINYEGYEDYTPGDNVVQIFAMGALVTEAIEASDKLKAKGIYANVIVVTSPDLLLGNLAYQDDYQHLKVGLGIHAHLYLKDIQSDSSGMVQTLAGQRIPIVSVHDGEIGLLDNIGSIVGVKHIALGVRKHSKCGRPSDVYRYHGLDADAIVEAGGRALSETALENLIMPGQMTRPPDVPWSALWPTTSK